MDIKITPSSGNDGLHGREPWEWLPGGDTLGVCSPSTSTP